MSTRLRGDKKSKLGGGGVAIQKKPKKKPKKTSPKFEICGSVRYFSVFFGFFLYFSVFFGLNFDKKFLSFKNRVNNEVLGGQELPNNTLNAYKAQKMFYNIKAIKTNKNYLTRTG